MSTEIQAAPQFPNPITGEVLSLASPDDDLARWLSDMREYRSQLTEIERAVKQEFLARMDRQAAWTIHAGGVKVSGTSPASVEDWDGAELRTALLALVDEGVVDISAVDAAVETVVEYCPRKRGIAQLRKLGGRVAAAVDGLARVSEPERRISVGGSTRR